MPAAMSPEQARQIVDRLLKERRLSQWESGYLRALQPHQPTPTQIEVVSRLASKYNLDLSEREVSSEREEHKEGRARLTRLHYQATGTPATATSLTATLTQKPLMTGGQNHSIASE
jgi:hypothetical protein